MSDGPGNANEILSYHHCGKCLEELPLDTSPQEWARVQTGWTPIGLQVWCVRHDINIMHVDFQGQQHPANLTANVDHLKCEHDKGLTEYCEPCGRIHGNDGT